MGPRRRFGSKLFLSRATVYFGFHCDVFLILIWISCRERGQCVCVEVAGALQHFNTLQTVRAMGSAVTVQAAPMTASLLESEPNEPAVR